MTPAEKTATWLARRAAVFTNCMGQKADLLAMYGNTSIWSRGSLEHGTKRLYVEEIEFIPDRHAHAGGRRGRSGMKNYQRPQNHVVHLSISAWIALRESGARFCPSA